MKVQTLLHLNKKISDIEEEIEKDQMTKAEAFEDVVLQVDREAGRLAVRRLIVFMQRTAAAALGCLSTAGLIVQESKHVSDGDSCSDGGVVQKSAASIGRHRSRRRVSWPILAARRDVLDTTCPSGCE